jgi:hypothetical protein
MADRTPVTTGQKPTTDTTATVEASASCTKTIEPNKMVFFYPTPDQPHEIYIPRGEQVPCLQCVLSSWPGRMDVIQLTVRVIAGQGYEE